MGKKNKSRRLSDVELDNVAGGNPVETHFFRPEPMPTLARPRSPEPSHDTTLRNPDLSNHDFFKPAFLADQKKKAIELMPHGYDPAVHDAMIARIRKGEVATPETPRHALPLILDFSKPDEVLKKMGDGSLSRLTGRNEPTAWRPDLLVVRGFEQDSFTARPFAEPESHEEHYEQWHNWTAIEKGNWVLNNVHERLIGSAHRRGNPLDEKGLVALGKQVNEVHAALSKVYMDGKITAAEYRRGIDNVERVGHQVAEMMMRAREAEEAADARRSGRSTAPSDQRLLAIVPSRMRSYAEVDAALGQIPGALKRNSDEIANIDRRSRAVSVAIDAYAESSASNPMPAKRAGDVAQRLERLGVEGPDEDMPGSPKQREQSRLQLQNAVGSQWQALENEANPSDTSKRKKAELERVFKELEAGNEVSRDTLRRALLSERAYRLYADRARLLLLTDELRDRRSMVFLQR